MSPSKTGRDPEAQKTKCPYTFRELFKHLCSGAILNVMKRKTTLLIVGGLAIFFIALLFSYLNNPNGQAQGQTQDEQVVRAIVSQFGSKLKMVSLLAPHQDIAKAMDDNYAPYVASELLTQWKDYPEYAPGRLTSSPSPDRIEILSVQTDTEGSFTVLGNVIETTSADSITHSGAKTYPITVRIENRSGAWLITLLEGYPEI